MIKISIVIPIYNMKDYIKSGLDRILQQSFSDFEIILVNDGSCDGSKIICDQYAEDNDKVKVIHKENGGAGSARNKGIELAQGKYIMFIDIDDIIEDDMLEIMFNEIENTESDLVICNHNLIKNESLINNAKNLDKSYSVTGMEECRATYIDLLKKSLIQTPWDKIYKLSIIKDNNLKFSDLRRCQDTIFNCNYFSYVNSYSVIKDCLYNYKENNLTDQWKKFPKNYFDICLTVDQIYTSAVRAWTINNKKNEEYLARYFLDETMQCIKYCFSPNWNFNTKERKKYIISILNNKRVMEALQIYRSSSIYQKILAFFMKKQYINAIIAIVRLNIDVKLKIFPLLHNTLRIKAKSK